MSLVGEHTRQTPHFSLLREKLRERAGAVPLEDWIVEEFNRRGHFGAMGRGEVGGAPEVSVRLEELIVALATPDATAEGRHWKLIVRAIQKGPVEVSWLARLATQERADVWLKWLVSNVPASEKTSALVELAAALNPRDFRTPDYDYDFKRLERRPALKENGWRPPRG